MSAGCWAASAAAWPKRLAPAGRGAAHAQVGVGGLPGEGQPAALGVVRKPTRTVVGTVAPPRLARGRGGQDRGGEDQAVAGQAGARGGQGRRRRLARGQHDQGPAADEGARHRLWRRRRRPESPARRPGRAAPNTGQTRPGLPVPAPRPHSRVVQRPRGLEPGLGRLAIGGEHQHVGARPAGRRGDAISRGRRLARLHQPPGPALGRIEPRLQPRRDVAVGERRARIGAARRSRPGRAGS